MQNIKSHKKQIVKTCVLMLLIALACIFLLTSCKNYIAYDESFDFVVEKGCSDHYYRQLSDGQQKMYRMIYKEAQDIFNGENKRNLGVYKYSDYGITKQDALTVWYAFFFDAPKFFFMSNLYIYGDKRIQVEIAEEFRKKSVREKVWSKIQDSVEDIKELLKDVDNDVLKFKIIYDYIIDNSDYKEADTDEDLFDGYSCSIAGVLDGDASTEVICQGYARTLSYLCNMFGIECIYVSSEIRSHAVNAVKIDGSWYYADSTYDDKSGDYSYFLNGDDETWQKTIMKGRDESENYLRDSLPRLSNKACTFEYGDVLYRILSAGKCKVVGVSNLARNVVVPSHIGDIEVVEIDSGAFGMSSTLTSVTIRRGIKMCREYAFGSNSDVAIFCEEVVKPTDWVINLNALDNPMVWNCMESGITEEGIKWGLTNDGVMTVAGYCGQFDTAVIPESINGRIVTDICKNAFRRSSLKDIRIPKSVTHIAEYAFLDCRNLWIYCDVSEQPDGWSEDWNYSGCKVIWGSKDHGVTQDGIIWEQREDGITVSGYVGSDSDVSIPEMIDGYAVVGIGAAAFKDNDRLISVKIPKSILRIEDRAFVNCERLSIYCAVAEKPSDWEDNWSLFYPVIWDCIKYGMTPEGIKWGMQSDGGVVLSGYCGKSTEVVIPDVIDGNTITGISEHAFYQRTDLTVYCQSERLQYQPWGWCSVMFNCIDNGVTSEGIKWGVSKDGAVTLTGYVGNADKLSLPEAINGRKVTGVSRNAFRLSNFNEVELPASITNIENLAFTGQDLTIFCKIKESPEGFNTQWRHESARVVWGYDGEVGVTENGLKWALTYGGNITVISYIGDNTRVVIPSDIDGRIVNRIGNLAFAGRSDLKYIELPISIKRIDEGAFKNCSSLTGLTIPVCVDKMDRAFDGCKNLTLYCEAANEGRNWSYGWNSSRPIIWQYNNITTNVEYDYVVHGDKAYLTNYKGSQREIAVPDKINDIAVVSIGRAFKGNSSIVSVDIPGSVEYIESYVFYQCFNLMNITIQNGVIGIGDNAFVGFGSIASIVIPISVNYIGSKAIYSRVVYCKAESKPDGWDENWCSSSDNVIWGYKEGIVI